MLYLCPRMVGCEDLLYLIGTGVRDVARGDSEDFERMNRLPTVVLHEHRFAAVNCPVADIERHHAGLNVAEIAAIEGLAGIHVGPADLALGLGLGIDVLAPAFIRGVERIVASAHDRGLPATMHAVAPEQIEGWIELGFDELVLTTDIDLLRKAFADLKRSASDVLGISAEPATAPSGYMA